MEWSYLSRRRLLPSSFQPIKNKVIKSEVKEEFYLRGEELILLRSKPSEQTWFELLVYYCYIKESQPLRYATIQIPHYETVTYDLSNWGEEKEFRRVYSYFYSSLEEVERKSFQAEYGYHLAKTKLSKEFSFPQQIFLTSPQGKVKIKEEELEKIKQSRNPLVPLFVHGRYIYNLCSKDKWLIQAIKEELEGARYIGALGVVVHMGKRNLTSSSTLLSWEEGVEAMFENIEEIIRDLSPSPPFLILETCAKQGTEVLGDLDEFLDFYARLDKEKVKLCLDSCHVFAAGYEPLFFLQKTEERFPGSVLLVHFNDSKRERGSRVDRHETPGLGCIGYERMKALYEYCQEKKIPLLHE